jgi:hypothetical protein
MKKWIGNWWLVVAACILAAFNLLLPFILMRYPVWMGGGWNEVGDFVGGFSTYVINFVTIILLAMIWKSERSDDRETQFIDGFMTLLQMHVEERNALLRSFDKGNYFTYLWKVNINSVVARGKPDERRWEVGMIYEALYSDIANWYLSMYRMANYVETSEQSEAVKKRAMKLFRLSCEREEQRFFFLLLLMRDSTATTPPVFFRYDFFKYADVQEHPKFRILWTDLPSEWNPRRADT